MNKISTGVAGLDSILHGGYPAGKSTLLKGGAGNGKTVFCLLAAHSNLVAGNHVTFITCDENPIEIVKNMDNYNLRATEMIDAGQFNILDFRPNVTDSVVGEYELDAVLLRVQNNISGESPLLIIDSLQNLFMNIETKAHVTSLLKLFSWCHDRNITLLTTFGENLERVFEGYFEEYAADCVILLEQAVNNNLMTRYLRILKYRSSAHGTNAYPFLLTKNGISVFPITDATLERTVDSALCSTGIKKLDDMIGGGYLSSSSIMISGASGASKSLLAATFASSALKAGKKVFYISYEECRNEYINNAHSIGIDFRKYLKSEQLIFQSIRSVEMGLEQHLIAIINMIDKISPDLIVIDPITSLLDLGDYNQVKSLLVRFVAHIKQRNMTILLNELLRDIDDFKSVVGVSSMVDTWIKLRQIESNGELNRAIHIIKSRGNKTSNQVKEFVISDDGINIEDPYTGKGFIAFGSDKKQRLLIDAQRAKLLVSQLSELDEQIAAINKTQHDDIACLKIKSDLLEKKQTIELELQNTHAINQLNSQSRES